MRATGSNSQRAAVRTFLAVELPQTARSQLGTSLRELEAHASVLRLVAADAVHITVRFLGDVSVGRLADVEAAARKGADRVPCFTLRLSGLGSFPRGTGTPRVVWVGLDRDPGYALLSRLFELVEHDLEGSGFGRESRAFAPHLTVARVRDDRPPEEYEALRVTLRRLQTQATVRLSFDVSHLVMFRSDLSPQGPQYTALARLPLRLD